MAGRYFYLLFCVRTSCSGRYTVSLVNREVDYSNIIASDLSTMPKSRQCVFGCYTKGVTVHDFPNPEKHPQQFQAWLNIVGKPLKDHKKEDIYRKKKVCHIHFTDKDWNRNNRLNTLAVPSLHLPVPCLLPPSVQDEHGYTKINPQEILLPSSVLEDHCYTKISPQETLQQIEIIQENTEDSQHKTDIDTGTLTMSADENIKISSDSPSDFLSLSTLQIRELPSTSNNTLEIDCQSASAKMSAPVKECYNLGSQSKLYVASSVTPLRDLTNMPSTSKSLLDRGFATQKYASNQENIAFRHCAQTVRCPAESNERTKGSHKQTTLKVTQNRDMQRKMKNLKREIIRLKKKGKSFKARLENAEKLADDIAFQRIVKEMTSPAKLFTEMQFKQTSKKPKGRRFSLDQKILSLSLFKRSPKGYSLLSEYFTLPSKKTLKKLLSKIILKEGINKLIFEKIKSTVNEMNSDDALCTLIFDEMHLTPRLKYDVQKDEIKGFVTNEKRNIVDHALVFMVKGIRKHYKQPVAYYFTQSLKQEELKSIVKDVAKHVYASGLKIIATICDQSAVNVSTINSLIKETKEEYLRKGKEYRFNFIEICKRKIIPLYDVPHLLKGIRNNLLTKDLKFVDFKDEKKEKIIKWCHFKQLYEADRSYGQLKYLQKITEEHLEEDKINKMRVKLAAQIFSHSVAVTAEHLTGRGVLNNDCRNMIPFVLLIDNLFDSLNVSTLYSENKGKIYKNAVKNNSPHHALWQDAIAFFKNVTFLIKKRDGDKIRLVETAVPTIKKFIKTIEGFQEIWKILHHKYGFDAMLTRNFNQDPVEIFFGSIRSLGARNVSPDSIAFEGAYKALLLNNFSSRHSIKSNCEQDQNACLKSLKFFLNENITEVPRKQSTQNFIFDEHLITDYEVSEHERYKIEYVCGWVLKKCLKTVIKSCQICRKEVLASMASNPYMAEREYESRKRCLCYPSLQVTKCFYEIQLTCSNFLKKNVSKYNIKNDIHMFTDIFVHYPFKCKVHAKELKCFFEDCVINVIINSWCRSINRILNGNITYDGKEGDEIKHNAQIYYNKHKHFKNKK